MPEELEAELQATANLSPVSPSPVHTASPLVVPALQDTVESIDAMVAAAAATNGEIHAVEQNGVREPNVVASGEDEEFVDDDNDPYGDDTTPAEPTVVETPAEQPDNSNDDYAKIFDSPINPEEGDGDAEVERQQDVSSVPRESNNVPPPADALTTRPSEISHISEPSSLAHPSMITPSAAQPKADDAAPTAEPFQTEAGHTSFQSHVTGGPTDGHSQEHPPTDLRQLVADLTAQHHDPNSHPDPSVSAIANSEQHPANNSMPSAATLPSSSSLPPRPPEPNAPSQLYPAQHHPAGSNSNLPASAIAPPTPGQPSTYVAAGAPGTAAEGIGSLPPLPATGLNASTAVQSLNSPAYPVDPSDDYQLRWEQFVADEKQYMSEAKWDRFPEGSRIFIGNLSSDKVSKRDVFDLFHRFGRLAQISLKSAYGFVQYHTVEEGHRAIENLQGVEIKGRRVHLEISKLQDKSKKERGRSPDRGRGGRDGGRRNERLGSHRDDYRGRNHSPRRNDHHHDGYGRDRGFHDSGRGRGGRSRSPGYGRNGRESYRRRSPSPYGRSRHETEVDLPRRYGADVPDVQILLQADVNRDFVAWIEGAFQSKGLATNNMFLHPRIPKDQIIQRQAAEGVHAVVDLDMRAQSTGKIPVQAFDRSAGSSNVRFDQYVDLDPLVAAEVVLRTKSSSAPSAPSAPSYGQPYSGAPAGYPQGYGVQPPAGPTNYYGAPQPGAYPPQQQPPANPADIAALIGQVDPSTLQQLLATVQASQGGVPGAPANVPQGNAPQMGQADLQAILSNLSGNPSGPPQQVPQGGYGAPYGGQPGPHGPPSQPGNSDSSAQVQNIMAHLARYR